MSQRRFFKQEADIIYTALSMRKCYIETGTTYSTANDLRDRGEASNIKRLSMEQHVLIKHIEELMKECLEATMSQDPYISGLNNNRGDQR